MIFDYFAKSLKTKQRKWDWMARTEKVFWIHGTLGFLKDGQQTTAITKEDSRDGRTGFKITENDVCLFGLIVAFSGIANGAKPEWFRKMLLVNLGVTTREEFERLFRNPTSTRTAKGEHSIDIQYQVSFGKLTVTYSLGRCPEGAKTGYRIDADRVVGMSVNLFREIRFSKLGLNSSTFERFVGTDTNSITFIDRNRGIRLFGSDKKVSAIDFDLGENQKSLWCSD